MSQMLGDFKDYVSGPGNARMDTLKGSTGSGEKEEENTFTFVNLNSYNDTQEESSMTSTI